MLLIREIMYCKRGKSGHGRQSLAWQSSAKKQVWENEIMTDFCAERYWTIVTEFEVPSSRRSRR